VEKFPIWIFDLGLSAVLNDALRATTDLLDQLPKITDMRDVWIAQDRSMIALQGQVLPGIISHPC
jgi:hypothetical protein